MNYKKALDRFHPLVKEWFLKKYKKPTPIQNRGWSRISSKDNVFISSPTGTGKTLTAFLWALNELIDSPSKKKKQRVSILYVSPLKALNQDIHRNLEIPLEELKKLFKENHINFPNIKIFTRSGDTPQSQRRKMLHSPPHILITTPESLALLLNNKKSRPLFQALKTVILDEIHSVISEKRGSFLLSSLERLTRLSPDFQRVALSATVSPLELAAQVIGGYKLTLGPEGPLYKRRPVKIISNGKSKKYHIQIISPPSPAKEEDQSPWSSVAALLLEKIKSNRSTLIFCNTRKLTEEISRYINELAGKMICHAHHGSLDKKIRSEIEDRLKRGEIRAIAATNSLELGIDIGFLDEVYILQTPSYITSAIQRFGRAGHRINETSRGFFVPSFDKDILYASVMIKAIENNEIEDIHPIENPLDILAQLILALSLEKTWKKDELYYFIRTIYSFHHLDETSFIKTLKMLAGYYEETRIKELKPRIIYHEKENLVQGLEKTRFLLNRSGGAIPDRGYFNLKLQDKKGNIGELDEEFVWERKIGDTFSFGNKNWRITDINDQSVKVVPWEGNLNSQLFWKGEAISRDYFYMEKILLFMGKIENKLNDPGLPDFFTKKYHMKKESAEKLQLLLKKQRLETGALPTKDRIIVEESGDYRIIHHPGGAKINKPLSMLIGALYQEKYHYALDIYADDFSIIINLPPGGPRISFWENPSPEYITKQIKRRLFSSGVFAAIFRENAGRALLLPSSGFQKRTPLWLNRLRSKKLLKTLSNFPDFPIISETWRSCLYDIFDLPRVYELVRRIHSGGIKIHYVSTPSPSSFVKELIWRQTNQFMYEPDQVLPEAVLTPEQEKNYLVRHSTSVSTKTLKLYQDHISRLYQFDSIQSEEDLILFFKTSLFISLKKWNEWKSRETLLASFEHLLYILEIPEIDTKWITITDILPKLHFFFSDLEIIVHSLKTGKSISKETTLFIQKSLEKNSYSRKEIFMEWLSRLALMDEKSIFNYWRKDLILPIIDSLLENGTLIKGRFIKGSEKTIYCSKENYIQLLQFKKKLQPSQSSSWRDIFPSLIRNYMKKTRSSNLESLLNLFEGFPLPYQLWEDEIFSKYIPAYRSEKLDTFLSLNDWFWRLSSNQLRFYHDKDMIQSLKIQNESSKSILNEIFPPYPGKYSLFDLDYYSSLDIETIKKNLLGVLLDEGWITNESYNVIRLKKNKLSQKRAKINLGYFSPINISNSQSALDQLEISKKKVRLLLTRYPLFYKSLLKHESPPFKWKHVAKALSLMSLSGEVESGYFCREIDEIQYCFPEILKLPPGELSKSIFFLNSLEIPCLYGFKFNKDLFPPKHENNHVVFYNEKPVLVSIKHGSEVHIHCSENKFNSDFLSLYQFLTHRDSHPVKVIKIKKINGSPSLNSYWKPHFLNFGFKEDLDCLLYRYGFSF